MSKGKRGTRKLNNSKRIEEVISDDSDLMSKFFVVAAVILVILCFYILTVHITNKNKDTASTENRNSTVEISDDKIILGKSLSMDGDYYVIYYENGNNTIEEIVNNYNGELSLYKVDMSSAFNKKYATDSESNKNPSKASEFLINGPTLIKVSDKKVVEYIEGEEEIRTILN